MDLSIHHVQPVLYVPPFGNGNNMVCLREVNVLHGRVLQIRIAVLNIAFEKEVGAIIKYTNLERRFVNETVKAIYMKSEKNPDGDYHPNLDIFEIKYDLTENNQSRTPWSLIINILPYYNVNSQHYEDDQIENQFEYNIAEKSIVETNDIHTGYSFKIQIASKFESDLAWELLEKEAGINSANEARNSLLSSSDPKNTNRKDFLNMNNNEVFWKSNFKDAFKSVGGTQKIWNRLCHSSTKNENDSSSKIIVDVQKNNSKQNSHTLESKNNKNKNHSTNNNTNSHIKRASWMIPGCEEFYLQELQYNPYSSIAAKSLKDKEKSKEQSKNSTSTKESSNQNTSSNIIANENMKQYYQKYENKNSKISNHSNKSNVSSNTTKPSDINIKKSKIKNSRNNDVNLMNKTNPISNEATYKKNSTRFKN